jgi:hypothetical protein
MRFVREYSSAEGAKLTIRQPYAPRWAAADERCEEGTAQRELSSCQEITDLLT